MTFDEILDQVITLLKRQGRVSYRALKMRFNLDDEYLEKSPFGATFSGSTIHPPPGEITIEGRVASSWVIARSMARNASSPSEAKISPTDMRWRRSIS